MYKFILVIFRCFWLLISRLFEVVDLIFVWVFISVSTLFEGVVIGVDGVEVGIIFNDIEVIEGIRMFRLKKLGYKFWEFDLDV